MIPGEYPARRAACLDSAKLFGVKSLRFVSMFLLMLMMSIIMDINDNDKDDDDDHDYQGGEQRDAGGERRGAL